MTMVNNRSQIMATQCDAMSGWFLYNGKCINSPIQGLYMDQQTGWYLPCDCKCKTCAGSSKMCTACGNGLVLLNGTCTPSVTITGAWWSDDLSSLNFAFSSQVKFYNKAKAAPAPSGVMCFN